MNAQREGYADGQRHGWIDRMCAAIEKQAHGKAAQALLDSGDLPERAAVVALPVWRWSVPGIDIGRKGTAADGGRLLMPIRVVWSSGPVVLVPNGRRRQPRWRSAGLGLEAIGQTRIAASRGDQRRDGAEGLPPTSIVAPLLGRREIRAELLRLVAEGSAARWDALTLMQPRVREAVHRANAVISRDVGGDDSVDLLDEHQVDALQQDMLLGAEGSKDSPALRLFQRCVDDEAAFVKVDPLKLFVTALRRDAQQQVQVLVGDPRPGRKIRALAEETGITDPAELVALYRERYPRDQVAIRRIQRALTVHARSLEVRRCAPNAAGLDGVVPDFADEVVDRLSRQQATQRRHPARAFAHRAARRSA